MTSDRRSDILSSFDQMLAENRDRLNALSTGSGADPFARPGAARDAGQESSAPPSHRPNDGIVESAAVRHLNDRYGTAWRYEVADRRREGDEAIVLCKLIIDENNVTKAQFGRARIGDAGTAPSLAGTSGGVSFEIGQPPSRDRSSGGDSEDAAFDRALDAALAKCVALI